MLLSIHNEDWLGDKSLSLGFHCKSSKQKIFLKFAAFLYALHFDVVSFTRNTFFLFPSQLFMTEMKEENVSLKIDLEECETIRTGTLGLGVIQICGFERITMLHKLEMIKAHNLFTSQQPKRSINV